MRVGIDGIPLLTPKTGIGKYTFELSLALSRLPEGPQLIFFYGMFWSRNLKANIKLDGNAQKSYFRAKISQMVPAVYKKRVREKVSKIGLQKYKPDLFHATNYVGYHFDVPTVVTVHDISFVRYPETHPAERLSWLSDGLERTLKQAKHVIVDSQFTKDELISLFDMSHKKISVVHLGIGQEFKPMDDHLLANELKRFNLKTKGYILSVGTLEPRKNIPRLLQAYNMLANKLKKRWPLVIVGIRGWKEMEIAKQMDTLARSGNLRILGYIPDEQIPFIYAGAALFLYPSLYEGFGLPPLEAMASGVPVIASNRGSLPEVIGNAGTLVDPIEIDSLSQTMSFLLTNHEKRNHLTKMGLQQAEKFRWSSCAEKTFTIYKEVLQRND